jgi:23S rRNA pseudouridine1911/1915/1917 synthase
MQPKVIFQDESLIILNKPSGWIVNEATTTTTQPVIQTYLAKNFDYPISKSREFRNGIVHRLDKETSGVLVVAKTEAAFSKLQEEFKERIVKKTYLALVHGSLKPGEGEVNVPVGRLPWRRDRFGVLPGGHSSSTKYQVKDYYANEKDTFSLVNLYPETGRTHQIRIHMKYLGHPLVADEFYAGRKTARNDRKWCPRLFLHALNISFIHPVTNKSVTFVAPIAKDLKEVISKLAAIEE